MLLYNKLQERSVHMSKKHTLNELNSMSREDLITIVLTMQGQLDMRH